MSEQKATNVTWHDHAVSKAERCQLSGHKGAVLWFTGLSASGKSTVANVVDHKLHTLGKRTYVLDGDNIRMGLNKNLGFSAEDRAENIRRIGEVGKLFSGAGVLAITAFISPYRKDRDAVRALLEPGEFVEVFMDTPLARCHVPAIRRKDPVNLYCRLSLGEKRISPCEIPATISSPAISPEMRGIPAAPFGHLPSCPGRSQTRSGCREGRMCG
ncbi:MAG: adenylyl-sulfate kinase [Planctomycetota bacterium]|nr:adenylyl-sulfate kinase [Planctomycetota bacterium]